MELVALALSFFLPLLLFFLLIDVMKKNESSNGDMNLPPGPWQLPIIGSMQLLLFNLPHLVFKDLAEKHGDLIHFRVGEISMVVASSADAAREIFKTHDLALSDRPQTSAIKNITYDCKDLAFASYGDHWRSIRKTCVIELLSVKRVLSFRPIREDETFRFITSIGFATSPINLSKMLHNVSTDITGRAVFGDHCKDKEDALSVFKEADKAITAMGIADFFPSSSVLRRLSAMANNHMEIRRKMDRVLNRIIQDRRNRTDDEDEEETLLDVLLRIHDDDGGLTLDSLKGVIFDAFTAGSETTSASVEWTMSELVKNPRVMEKSQAEVRRVMKETSRPMTEDDIKELSYLRLVIKESLRLHPPAPLIGPRVCRYSCRVMGYDVPEKARVFVNVWAMGRDPRYWEKPLDFSPERFLDVDRDYKGSNYEYLPFGGGRRICPGISFGVASIEIILAQLLYYFDWKLPGGRRPEELDMTESFGDTVGRKNNLFLCPIPRINLHPPYTPFINPPALS